MGPISATNDPVDAIHRRAGLVCAAVAALVAGPILVDLAFGGPEAPFRYLAPDSFYYHTIARNVARHGVVAFDGEHPTNGFHPLWQAVSAALYATTDRLGWSELAYLRASVALGAALAAAGVWLLLRTAFKAGHRAAAATLLVPAGAYALALLPAWVLMVDVRSIAQPTQGPFPLFGTMWSFANGMESGLLLLLFAAAASALAAAPTPTPRSSARLGLLCAGMVLARLDHVFFVAGFAIVLALEVRRAPRRGAVLGLVAFAAAAALPVVAYLAASSAFLGSALPSSGALKSTFPAPHGDNVGILAAVIEKPWRDPLAPSRLYRCAQLLLPAACAVVVLIRQTFRARRREPADDAAAPLGFDAMLRATAIGVVLLAGYDFLFVRPFAMGHWYVPVSILFVSLAVLPRGAPREAAPARRATALVLCAAAALALFWFEARRPTYHALYAHCYLVDAPDARTAYGPDPPRLVEYDDGIVSFATGFPAISGIGLAGDAESVRALREGRLQELALDRGFDRVASLVYLVPEELRRVPASDRRALANLGLASFRDGRPGTDAEIEYVSPSGRLWILRCRR